MSRGGREAHILPQSPWCERFHFRTKMQECCHIQKRPPWPRRCASGTCECKLSMVPRHGCAHYLMESWHPKPNRCQQRQAWSYTHCGPGKDPQSTHGWCWYPVFGTRRCHGHRFLDQREGLYPSWRWQTHQADSRHLWSIRRLSQVTLPELCPPKSKAGLTKKGSLVFEL